MRLFLKNVEFVDLLNIRRHGYIIYSELVVELKYKIGKSITKKYRFSFIITNYPKKVSIMLDSRLTDFDFNIEDYPELKNKLIEKIKYLL